jgi:hypothetical protein
MKSKARFKNFIATLIKEELGRKLTSLNTIIFLIGSLNNFGQSSS